MEQKKSAKHAQHRQPYIQQFYTCSISHVRFMLLLFWREVASHFNITFLSFAGYLVGVKLVLNSYFNSLLVDSFVDDYRRMGLNNTEEHTESQYCLYVLHHLHFLSLLPFCGLYALWSTRFVVFPGIQQKYNTFPVHIFFWLGKSTLM